ncbi:MAG: hypothetical protein ABSF00_02545 [Candidatus Bathyarchaeia archaeon]|jgi:hypothetical protein
MQTNHLLPVILGAVLLTLAATSVYADPLVAGGYVMVGNQYTVTTIRGEASAWVNGQWLTGPADLDLQVQVTFAGPNNIAFKVISGSFQVLDKPYILDVGNWRGNYNRNTATSVYQGPATAPDGENGYFVLFGQDTTQAQQGTYMTIYSDFRGEYGALWHVNLVGFRYN